MSNTSFNDNGKLGTKSNLFVNAMDTMPTASFENLYGSLAPIIAKQFVNIPDTPINPITSAFIGEALDYGTVIEDIFIKSGAMGATRDVTTATGADLASDEYKFEDCGIKVQYTTLNTNNTRKVSRFIYELDKAFRNPEGAKTLGDGIVETLRVSQISCLENQANKVLVSSMPNKCNVYCGITSSDSDATQIKKFRSTVIKTALAMAKVNGEYVAGDYSDGKADKIYVFMNREKIADLIMDKSGVFHPEYLEFEQYKQLGADIKLIMVDDFETPVTTSEITSYASASGITWTDAPGLNELKPDFIICDSRYFRINPFVDRYLMNSKEVNANDPFINFFIHMQNSIGYIKYRKAARGYLGAGVKVTFKNDDNTTVLQEGYITSGGTPVFNGDTSTLKSTDSSKSTYVFNGWNPSIGAVTSDTVYVATYAAPSP